MRRKPTVQTVKATLARDLAVASIVVAGGISMMLNSVTVAPPKAAKNSPPAKPTINQSNGMVLASNTKLNKAGAQQEQSEPAPQQPVPAQDASNSNTIAGTTQYVQTASGVQTIASAATGGQFMQGVWGNRPGANKAVPGKLTGKEMSEMLRASRERAKAQVKQ